MPNLILGEGLALHQAGFTVFPQPFSRKAGYPWKRLQYTRLAPQEHSGTLSQLISGTANLAIACGRTSGNLFVLDCESRAALIAQLEALTARRIPIWAVQTQRGGHIYLRAREGEVHNIATGILPHMEVRGRHAYVIAPGSVHPDGALYTWLIREGEQPPLVSVRAIDWLRDATGQSISLRYTPHGRGRRPIQAFSPASPLARSTREYIANGQSTPVGMRNNSLFRAACDLAGNNYSQDEAEALLLTPALLSGLPDFEVRSTLASAYSRTRQPSKPASATTLPLQVRHQWHYALLFALQHVWAGKGTTSQRAVFLALIERARLGMNQHGVFRASLRELAELARTGVKTVRNALNVFIADHHIFYVDEDATSGASLWRFSHKVLELGRKKLAALEDGRIPAHWLTFANALFTLEASESGALGKGGMFVYQFLVHARQPLTPSKLALASGITVNQANYALKKLKDLGLVRRAKQGWCVVELTDAELEAHVLAQRPQIKGRSLRRRQRFERERQKFAAALLYNARSKHEGDDFLEAVQGNRAPPPPPGEHPADLVAEAIQHPLHCEALLLGGVMRLPYGFQARVIR